MIPLPVDIKAKILDWLPRTLNDTEYTLKETDNIVPDLIAPAITYYFSSAGTPAKNTGANMFIRAVKNDNRWDDYWGEFKFCTMNVVLRSYDKAEMEAMWAAFLDEIEWTRRDLNLRLDHVRYTEVLNSIPLEPQRLNAGKTLYWAQVDMRFEYEVSRISEGEYIERVNEDIASSVDGEEYSHIYFEDHILTRELTGTLTARIEQPT